ncbi:hypothetical protein K2173_006396 [Erythroxylum novogranatense]|uniref:AMP-activated protein kinase glycogen-binding domain-containing protein n=1 Tax=Erythroxylum novogranatense TaxID=1862640 RepID=A0AAV8U4I2_9ROSI|nr:hypothetical protein K2173_006396 [Erythroxylum novogranatense]
MLSFTDSPISFRCWPDSLTHLNTHYCPLSLPECSSRRYTRKKQRRVVSVGFVSMNSLGFVDVKRREYRDSCWDCFGGFVMRCRKGWESEGGSALEAEILEFMENSENPDAFPSKKQLIDAGRLDLVESIVKQGGWLAMGWDLDDHQNQKQEVVSKALLRDRECISPFNQERVSESIEERGSSQARLFLVASASSSGRSLEIAAEDDSGTEGILHRLEKERNRNLGFGLRRKGGSTNVQSNDLKSDWLAGASETGTVAGLTRNNKFGSSSPQNNVVTDTSGKIGSKGTFSSFDGLESSLGPAMWRTWSIQRAGNSNMEFAVDEFPPNATRTESRMGDVVGEILGVREVSGSSLSIKEQFTHEDTSQNDVKSRFQHLELEFSSVLKGSRSNNNGSAVTIGGENSTDDLLKLSDAWEFKENEIMNAQHELRSIRAKLAVLEGKMALAIIDAQKIIEEKQKKVDITRRGLQILRTACVAWPNTASEMLLAGSFDGWTTQRKMERSRTGIFSLYLKLYPGRYEIKFIVDGVWKIDPLRPVVYNYGFENNLLIIT